jgi:polyribonucleotide nucleotidyltransferase
LILDPPTADVGAVYGGRVVNITKFGAFVNVLPGRDGLLHISKLSSLAGGKRINNVEDVLTLGQAVEVRVDDIDPQGKVSLSLASAPEGAPSSGGSGSGSGSANGDGAGASSSRSSSARSDSAPAKVDGTSFEDAFEAELVADLGDLGPGAAEAGNDRGGDRGGDRRPSRGRSRRR